MSTLGSLNRSLEGFLSRRVLYSASAGVGPIAFLISHFLVLDDLGHLPLLGDSFMKGT